MMQFWMVMSAGAEPLLSQLMLNVSSSPQATEQWSKIIFVPLAIPKASLPDEPPLPMRNFMWRTMQLSAPENDTASP